MNFKIAQPLSILNLNMYVLNWYSKVRLLRWQLRIQCSSLTLQAYFEPPANFLNGPYCAFYSLSPNFEGTVPGAGCE